MSDMGVGKVLSAVGGGSEGMNRHKLTQTNSKGEFRIVKYAPFLAGETLQNRSDCVFGRADDVLESE